MSSVFNGTEMGESSVSIHVKSYNLSAFGADRAKMLLDEGTLSVVRCPLWPEDDPAHLANQAEWWVFARKALPMWAWINCSADQAADVAALQALDAEFRPSGWILDIEKALEHADLSVLCAGAKALGCPVIASLGGFANPNHNVFDHRSLDRAGFAQEWQAYPESDEGPPPDVAVRELWQPSLVFVNGLYRSRIGTTYGWGRVTKCNGMTGIGYYDAYKFPGPREYEFDVRAEEWGWTVTECKFWSTGGQLLGLAKYRDIRVCILSDGLAADHGITRTLPEWTAYAASARAPGLARRPVAVFNGERASDEMLRAVAKGSG